MPYENFHLFRIVPVPLQQTVENELLQSIDEHDTPLPEFDDINGIKLFKQMNQETEIAQSKQINNGGDENGEEGQVLHSQTN